MVNFTSLIKIYDRNSGKTNYINTENIAKIEGDNKTSRIQYTCGCSDTFERSADNLARTFVEAEEIGISEAAEEHQNPFV